MENKILGITEVKGEYSCKIRYNDAIYTALVDESNVDYEKLINTLTQHTDGSISLEELTDTVTEICVKTLKLMKVIDDSEVLKDNFKIIGGNVVYKDYVLETELAKYSMILAKSNPKEETWRAFVNFVDNLSQNMSSEIRAQLFRWMSYGLNTGKPFKITPDGCFVGWRGCRGTVLAPKSVNTGVAYVDGVRHSGSIPNPIGAVISMPREHVQFDPEVGCASGLHVGTFEYASHWAHILLQVKVNPKDVVSVPYECDSQKIRCCEFKVLSVIDKEDWDSLLVEDETIEIHTDLELDGKVDGEKVSPELQKEFEEGFNFCCNTTGTLSSEDEEGDEEFLGEFDDFAERLLGTDRKVEIEYLDDEGDEMTFTGAITDTYRDGYEKFVTVENESDIADIPYESVTNFYELFSTNKPLQQTRSEVVEAFLDNVSSTDEITIDYTENGKHFTATGFIVNTELEEGILMQTPQGTLFINISDITKCSMEKAYEKETVQEEHTGDNEIAEQYRELVGKDMSLKINQGGRVLNLNGQINQVDRDSLSFALSLDGEPHIIKIEFSNILAVFLN